MTEAFRSAVAFRNDICRTVAQLQQRITRPLPDGATVYVTSQTGLYRLVKGLGSSFDNISSAIVVPADGSTNRWVLEEVSGSSPWSGVEVATASNTLAATGSNVWRALGATPGAFTLMAGDANLLQVSATSSVLTYHGPSRDVLLTATVMAASVGIADVIRTVLSHNDDVAIGSSADQHLKGEQGSDTASGASANITTQRAVTLADGDTVRLMARSAVGGADMTVSYYTLSVVPR